MEIKITKDGIAYRRLASHSLPPSSSSIDCQRLAIQKFCQQQKINILQSFEDIGVD